MKQWLNDGFSQSLWDRDVAQLADIHRQLAKSVFVYAVESLGSEPFQRESSRTGRSDGQTIFRTKLHRSFWLVLDTKSSGLQLHFPDKDDAVQSAGVLLVEKAPGTQWTRKKEKRIRIAFGARPELTAECLTLVDTIHTEAVEYYSRGADFSITLRTLLGPATGGLALPTPSTTDFTELLGRQANCRVCGTRDHLSIHHQDGCWSVYCDAHHPARSPYAAFGRDLIPFDVKRLVWHRDGGRCVSCGSENYATFDHMIPANRGGGNFSGSHLETNIRLKCRTCNYSKGNKLVP